MILEEKEEWGIPFCPWFFIEKFSYFGCLKCLACSQCDTSLCKFDWAKGAKIDISGCVCECFQ